MRKAIALIAEHARAGLELVLNVNLSGKSIGDRKLAALIEDALAETGIDPARLTFELTETAAIANVEDAKAFASRLRGRGCQFALDDFGAGFGSFYYLKNFPFDYLKIDGDFIRGLATSPMNQLVVKAIVSIARGNGQEDRRRVRCGRGDRSSPPHDRRRSMRRAITSACRGRSRSCCR